MCLDLLRKVGDTRALMPLMEGTGGNGEERELLFQVVVNVPNGMVVGVSPENAAAVAAWEKLTITRGEFEIRWQACLACVCEGNRPTSRWLMHVMRVECAELHGKSPGGQGKGDRDWSTATKHQLRNTEVAVLQLRIGPDGERSAAALSWLQVSGTAVTPAVSPATLSSFDCS